MASMSPPPQSFRLGPSGGTGGLFFQDKPGAGIHIANIYVHFGDYIDGLRIEWADGTDAYHGSCNGPAIAEFEIDHQSGEKLRGFDGSIGAHPDDGGLYVTSIRFHTQARSSAAFGKSSPTSFTYHLKRDYGDYSIIGFFGRACKYLDSIGPLMIKVPARPVVSARAQPMVYPRLRISGQTMVEQTIASLERGTSLTGLKPSATKRYTI
jgi:Jacalin-like lectin domain